ncbi:MAG: hypothetical protein KKD44_29300 [Proteobacteria bacterium]|nr:hypothetical protein [Pseudomonadota bacterium]
MIIKIDSMHNCSSCKWWKEEVVFNPIKKIYEEQLVCMNTNWTQPSKDMGPELPNCLNKYDFMMGYEEVK